MERLRLVVLVLAIVGCVRWLESDDDVVPTSPVLSGNTRRVLHESRLCAIT